MNFIRTLRQRGCAWINRRLERRIAAYSIATIIGISLIFGVVSFSASLWLISRQQSVELEHQLIRIVARLDDKVDLFVRHTQDLSKNPLVLSALLDSKGRNIYLLPFFSHYRFPLAEPHGLALCDFEGKRLAEQEWYRVGCLPDLPQSQAVIDTEQPQALMTVINQQPHLVLFQPVLYPGTGRAEGYILTALNVLSLVTTEHLVGTGMTLRLHSADGTLDFVDKTGVLMSPERPDEWHTRPLFTTGSFATAGLTLSLYQHTTRLAGLEYLLLAYGIGTLLLLALTLLLSHRLARRLAEPLLALNDTARRIAVEGPTTAWVVTPRTDEVGELADSFNQMIVVLRQAQEELEARVQARTQALQNSEERYRSAVTALAEGVIVYDLNGAISAANPAAERILGLSLGQDRMRTVNDDLWCITQPDGTPFPSTEWPSVLTLHDGIPRRDVLMGVYRPDDHLRWLMVSSEPIHDPTSGAVQAAVVSFSDITARKAAEDALRESESRFHTLVDLLPYGIQENDLTGRITFANPALERLHGALESSVVGRFIWDFLAEDAERASLRDYLQQLLREQPPPIAYFSKDWHTDGYLIDVQVDWTYRRDECGQVRGFIAVVTDITDRKQMQEELREQAIRDRLTGLYNRRYLDETLPRELSRCQRSGEPLTVAMLDLDHFKHFNDIYGHEAGDAVLQSVGDLLNRSLRAGDIACRYGGEELTLILHGCTLENARLRLDNLRQAIMRLRLLYRDSELPMITVSIGVATTVPEESNVLALTVLARADAALYQAKKQGRNQVVAAVD